MPRSLRLLALVVGLAAAPTVLPVAHAQPTQQATVTVEASLVKASREGEGVDPSLKAVARDLKRLPFTRFDAVGEASWRTSPGRSGKGDVGQGIVVKATVTSVTDDTVGVSVTVERGGKVVSDTAFERPWGRAHVLSVGRDGGATLLVPIRVTR